MLTEARVFVQRVLMIATSHRRFVEVLAGAIETVLLLLPLVGITQLPAAVPALGDPARASAEPASTSPRPRPMGRKPLTPVPSRILTTSRIRRQN